jgi:hypothetical protein
MPVGGGALDAHPDVSSTTSAGGSPGSVWRTSITRSVLRPSGIVGWDAIEVGHVVGMRSVRFEADVVRGEVALELQIVVDDLLEDVFLHRLSAPFDAAPAYQLAHRL